MTEDTGKCQETQAEHESRSKYLTDRDSEYGTNAHVKSDVENLKKKLGILDSW
jgi:hypothetical protein